MTNKEITKALAEPFPREALKSRPVQGRNLTYVDGTTVMRRLISATDNCWNMQVLDQQIQPWTPTKTGTPQLLLTARVRLEIPGMGSREHMGVQIVQEGGGEDMWKGAITDALKKAATLFGVGLELYGPDYEADTGADAHQRPQNAPQRTEPSQMTSDTNGATPHAQRPITHRQKQLIFALANEIAAPNRWPSDWVKDDLYTYFAVDSTTKLTTAQGAHAIRALQQVRTTGQPFSDALAATKGA